MKKYFFTASIVFHTVACFAQIDPVDKNGIGIGGYDLVSYFTPGKLVKGEAKYMSVYKGVAYYFLTRENQTLFEANPQKYVPQYDGYCALAVSYGRKVSIDPETFKLLNNKLYLFFNGKTSHGRVNSLGTWNKNEAKLLERAEALWPDVQKKKYEPEKGL